MFNLSATAHDGVQFGFDIREFSLRASYIHLVDQASFVARLLEAHGIPAQRNRRFDYDLFVVERANEVVIRRHICGEGKEHHLQIGHHGVCVGARRFDRAPHTAPDVEFIAEVE